MKRIFPLITSIIGGLAAMVGLAIGIVFYVVRFVFRPLHGLRNAKHVPDMHAGRFRSLRGIVPKTVNLFKAQGRNYNWQAGVGS